MSRLPPRALIADDEPLLRESFVASLANVWPQLQVVAQARNGRQAVELFDQYRPDICFLDVQMPGWSGIEAAQHIGSRAHLVFVTAYDEYAVEAFRQGVLDFLVKPVQLPRLAETVSRLQQRLHESQPARNTELLLQELLESWQKPTTSGPLRWIRASIGPVIRMIAVEDVEFLRADGKYTVVAWRGDSGRAGDALIRLPLKELVAQLDPGVFAQVHRSVVVNLHAIDHVVRGPNDTAEIHLKHRSDVLPVSRAYLTLFRQM